MRIHQGNDWTAFLDPDAKWKCQSILGAGIVAPFAETNQPIQSLLGVIPGESCVIDRVGVPVVQDKTREIDRGVSATRTY